MLHFGSYGGNTVRWMYLLLGLAGARGLGGAWNHAGAGAVVDCAALAAVPAFALIALRTRRSLQRGHADSIWSTRQIAPAASS